MDRDDWVLDPDSVRRALAHLTPTSGGLVMREAYYGVRRFDDFARHTGLTAPALSARLRALQADGLLEKRPYRDAGERTREEYRLTEQGRDLAVAIIALMRWVDRWEPNATGPTVAVRHRGCPGEVYADLACTAGHHGLSVKDAVLEPGPGARRRGAENQG